MESTHSYARGQAFVENNRESFPRIVGQQRWLAWFRDQFPQLSGSTRLVLITLVGHVGKAGECFPSLRHLVELTGLSLKVVRAAIAEAQVIGILKKTAHFDHARHSGGRQTSNRYEFLRHPLSSPAGQEELSFDLVDDSADPRQLELPSSTKPRVLGLVANQPENAPRAPECLEPRDGLRGPSLVFCREPPPSPLGQGVKREEKEEKANSTRTRAREGTPSNPAAASLPEILSIQVATELKRKFGCQVFGSVLFALRRNVCLAHPELAKRALARLLQAADVKNPGGYFAKVFERELEAERLAPLPEPEDVAHDLRQADEAALLARQKEVIALLERVQSRDLEAAQTLRVELDAIGAKRRALQPAADSSALPLATSTPATIMPALVPEPLSLEEIQALSQQALQRVKQKTEKTVVAQDAQEELVARQKQLQQAIRDQIRRGRENAGNASYKSASDPREIPPISENKGSSIAESEPAELSAHQKSASVRKPSAA